VADVVAAPEGEPLPAVEEFGRLVIGHRDRHLGVVAGVQRLLVIPADFGGEDPGPAGTVQPGRLDHERMGVVQVALRRRS
jgi:hypothetical protein